ncbi:MULTISPECIES: HAD family hydrolase [unclassified Marinovum]
MTATPALSAVLFDKDGTLFDFSATWDLWAGDVITQLSGGDDTLRRAIAGSARYDLEAQTFFPDSPVIAGTNREAAECLARVMPGQPVDEVELFLIRSASHAPLHPAVPLDPLLTGLAARGLRLGVVTNDTEVSARAHLETAAVTGHFDFIAGFDSGFGMKPGPEPLLAFAEAIDVAPETVAMVGDSVHDLLAGRRAGMVTVGVLTGPATAEVLAPYADVVLPDIGHLPGWLDGR